MPEKYKVIIGRGENIGFCTVWNDPEIVLKKEPDLLNYAAIIGTLYSREGVNIILRNLCLNPQITHLFIWGNGHLSKTQIGVMGKEMLKNLWNKDFKQEYKIHPTIDLSVIKKVIKNVELIDVSDMELRDVLEKMKKINKKPPYMDPVSFPDYQPIIDKTLPSEEVGFVVRGKKIIDAWIKVLDKIMRYGTIKSTEYGNQQRELQVITWVIEDEDIENFEIPNWPENLKKIIGLEKNLLNKYAKTIFFDSKLPEGVSYTYGNRLFNFPSNENINQIEYMINKIKEFSNTRRAISVLFHPYIDKNSKSPPCLTMIQVLVNNKRLNMFAVFRSHDIFKAGVPNAFGLRKLQSYIAKETGYEVGKLSITSNSAHIYEEDWENAKKLCMCEIWEKPIDPTFDPTKDSDPRANVIINLVKEKIVVDILSPNGDIIISLSGDDAKQLMKKIANLDLLSKPEHWGYLGMELQKAEIARDMKKDYKQDKKIYY